MYKGFFEDLEYVASLFFKPFEGCCEKDDIEDDEEERECSMGCDQMPCFREGDDEDGEESKGCDQMPCFREDDDEDDGEESKGCDLMPCCKDDEEDDEEDKKSADGFMGSGPLTDIMKCMFDASDVDYDYED